MLVRRGPNRRVSVRSAQYRAFAFSRHIFFSRLLGFSIKFDTSGRNRGWAAYALDGGCSQDASDPSPLSPIATKLCFFAETRHSDTRMIRNVY
jgi:hypothetical protein